MRARPNGLIWIIVCFSLQSGLMGHGLLMKQDFDTFLLPIQTQTNMLRECVFLYFGSASSVAFIIS